MNAGGRLKLWIALVAAISIAIVGTIAARLLSAPPGTPPDYSGPRPIAAADGYVTHSEQIVVDLPLRQYYEWANAQPLEAGLQEQAGIPSVVRTGILQGNWNDVGARRRVELSDGHYAVEEVIAKEDPVLFRYQVWGYTNFARFATDHAIGEFRFAEAEGKTQVTWTYSFHARSRVASGFLANFVRNDWAAYMRQYLEYAKRASEADARERLDAAIQ